MKTRILFCFIVFALAPGIKNARAYSINVTKPLSSNANLANLTISSGTLTPGFATATQSYTVNVPNATTSVTVTPTTADATATVTVNTIPVTSGTASSAIALAVGFNQIKTVVTAQDGTVKTYFVTVTRAQSSNADLSSLTISSGTLTPVFATATINYTASVTNGTTSVKVTPTTSDATARIKVNGTAIASGNPSQSIALATGANTISVVVTAQDGTVQTYTVTVTRALSPNANMASLTISSGTLTPVFATATTSYTDTVTNATTSVTVTPTTSDVNATVTVNGTTVTSGSASSAITLPLGPTLIKAIVTAQDGTVKSYFITVTRPKSSNANLSNLAISSGTLTPVFASGTLSYTASVTFATISVHVTPTVSDATATVTVNGTGVASGTASAAISLNTGANTITTVVTAQDGTMQTYTIVITRVSSIANLSNLVISSGTLTPVFATGTTTYTASVTNATTSITVTPTTSDGAATVTVNGTLVTSGTASGALPLAVGANVIKAVGIAQDGTQKSYFVTVTRAASSNANLSNLTISSGTLTPSFATATTSYTASVTNATTSIKVTPTTSDATATVTVNGTTVASGTASTSQPLATGANTISVVVTAQDGTLQTYTIIVTRALSSNANLANFTISSGTLTPAFATATQSYTAIVTNATASITATPTTSDAAATVTVNGTTVTSGSASGPLALSVGVNTIATKVTAQDGSTVKTYTLTVTRSGASSNYTWTGSGANRNWSNNANWSPSTGHPLLGDTVTIGTTANLPTVDVSSACSVLTISGTTTITLAASLNAATSLTLNAPLTVSGAVGSFTTNSLAVNSGGTLTNSRTFTVSTGNISLAASTNINNLAAGTFNATGTPVISLLTSSTITNAGIFNISAASVNMGNSTFINNASGGTFTVNGGSTIDFATNSATSAYILNNGTFFAGTSGSVCTVNLNFAGVSLQNTNIFNLGSTSVINLTGSGTSLQNTGTFTLQSDVNGSATIGNISGASATCTGMYSVQRYITGGTSIYRGYRLISSPVYASTVSGNNVYSLNYVKLTSYITGTTGTTGGFDNPGAGNPTLYLFRENIASSNATFTSGNYRGINDITAAPSYTLDIDGSGFFIPSGDGFLFFFRGDRSLGSFATETTTTYVPTSATLTSTGTLNQGQIVAKDWYTPTSSNLGFTNTAGNSSVQGFNLVGNPYASSINWDTYNATSTTTGIYATNLNPFIYVLDPVSKNYNVYSAGNGGVGTIARTNSNIIPSGQGFFVVAANSSAQLIFNESAKTNSQANAANSNLFLGTAPQTAQVRYLRVQLAKDAINADATYIGFVPDGKSQYVINEDAPYLPGQGDVSLSSISSDNVQLAINKLPLPGKESLTINLKVNAAEDGVYNLNLADVVAIPQLFDVWLMDSYKRDSLNLRANKTYAFTISKADSNSYGTKRFSLVIRQNPALGMHLLNFTAAKASNGAQVIWKTQNEQNYTNFTLERSTNGGATFNILTGFPSAALGIYSFLDKDPAIATNQYRLKIVDINGTISYSNVVTLIYGNSGNAVANNISVYPNPAGNVINLAIHQNIGSGLSANLSLLQTNALTPSLVAAPGITKPSYSIKIINATGLVVRSVTSSQSNWQDNVDNLQPGTYIIQVINKSDNSVVGKSTFVKL